MIWREFYMYEMVLKECSKDLPEVGSHSALKMLEDFELSSSRPRADTAESRNSPAVPSPLANHVENSNEEVPSRTLSSASPSRTPAEDTSSTSSVAPDPTAHHEIPSSSSIAAERPPSPSVLAGDTSKPIEAAPPLHQAHPVNESGSSPPPSMKPKPSSISISSRRIPIAASLRSASRASSIGTFATALESMGNTSSDDDYDEADEEPGTPRVAPQHILENTGTTIGRSGSQLRILSFIHYITI
ncbi:hypothetical protein EV421DRAFT_1901169 [Armillaria borealis]|uniref:Uncharacterized protein n=1 Tax=Armillaria borealis TaxID=47425 RepID=A0AA39MUF4_9AGAR|nr:hypothetical protein EV421DRAFT_1901169 [Armillaria borealis]